MLIADIYSLYRGQREIYVIGGSQMYSEFAALVNEVWLTEVFAEKLAGDAKFEFSFDSSEWRTQSEHDYPISEIDQFPFRISHKVRIKKEFRVRNRDELLRRDPDIAQLLDKWESEKGQADPKLTATESVSGQESLFAGWSGESEDHDLFSQALHKA